MVEFHEWILQAEESQEENQFQDIEEGKGFDSGSLPHEKKSSFLSTDDQEGSPSTKNFHVSIYSHPHHHMLRCEQLDDASNEAPPQVCYCDSESSSSSLLEGLSMWSSDNSSIDLASCKRRVVFYKSVEVREYSLTVGDHPCCEGALSLSLDWQHADMYYKDLEESQQRGMFYKAPQRLSLQERRDRLIEVTGYEGSEVDALFSKTETASRDSGTLIGMFKLSWSNLTLLLQEHDDR